jgi:ADP-ribose pyrophosphatase YjhB (NUDIX family)
MVARVGVLHAWRWCPRCRTELERDDGRVSCPACGFVFYANSAPTANALVLDGEGRILLGRRAGEPEQGKWDILGGFLQEGEQPLDGVRRELREETALEIEPLEFLAVETDLYGAGDEAPATLNLFWTARVVSGEPEPADDVSELRWFPPEELPPDDELAFDVNARVLGPFRK